jgi:hypothetical protein
VQSDAAPATQHLKEVTTEIADLKRRIERQAANLEAEDTTPALRRRIAGRIAELEEAVEEHQERARKLAPPTRRPQPEMCSLLDSLHVQLAYRPAAQAVDVELTLLVDEPLGRRGEVAEVWSVPPGRVGPDLRRMMRLRRRLLLRSKR